MEGGLLQMSGDASKHPFHAQFCEGSFLNKESFISAMKPTYFPYKKYPTKHFCYKEVKIQARTLPKSTYISSC